MMMQFSAEPPISNNAEDHLAVAIYKAVPADVVGHVPREISRICWYLLHHDGEISCGVH